MRLSEAIRLGSLLVPEPKCGDIANGCAITMALRATGRDTATDENWNNILNDYPWLKDCPGARCPVCSKSVERDAEIVWHPFDRHVMGDKTMPLEQLCAYIRSIEPDEELCEDGLPLQGTCAVPECGNDRISRLEELCREHRDEAEAGADTDRSEHSRAIQGR